MPRTLSDDAIVEKLVQCFWLYGNYPVDSRGPAGLLIDIIHDLRPDVYEVIKEDDIYTAWKKFFAEDDEDEDDDTV